MKHIKIFEEHNDVPDIARSVFGLEKTFKIFDVSGDTGIRISGPLEEEDNVAPIIKSIHNGILALAGSTVRFDIKNAWRIAVNDLVRSWEKELSEFGYHVDSWYNH